MRFFNRVTLQTPESVELEFILAGIGSRALAVSIDYPLLLLLLALWITLLAQLLEPLAQILEPMGISRGDMLNWMLAIGLLTCFALFNGYFALFETFWQGQTPGKRLVKIRVIRDDGRPVRLGQASLRALLTPIDNFLFLGFFMILLGKREKRVGDWVAGTVVIQEQQADVGSSAFPLSGQAQNVADALMKAADFTDFLPDDFGVVREYLRRRSGLEPRAKQATCLNLARQARGLLKLEQLPFEMTADEFLEGLYLAYQQQES
jgi:uncharacterized RDD family membrane protein YckC